MGVAASEMGVAVARCAMHPSQNRDMGHPVSVGECGWLGLLKLYVVEGGDYARFWKYISPVFMRGLAIFGSVGGLTGFCEGTAG